VSESLDQTMTRFLSDPKGLTASSAAQLVPLLYQELRRLARTQLADQPPQTLQATALVNEVFMRLVGKEGVGYQSREHFFFAAARAMHDILVEQARRRAALKRGGGARMAEASEDLPEITGGDSWLGKEDILAVSEALKAFEEADPEKARVVMLRYFAGLTMEEISAATGVPLRTLERQWRFAKAWLHARLSESLESGATGDQDPRGESV
jgi:RNA polymerase sigma factor (TIGR02999 family)